MITKMGTYASRTLSLATIVTFCLLIAVGLAMAGGLAPFLDEAYADEDPESSAASSAASAESDESEAKNVKPDDDNLVDPTQRADNSFIYDTTIESLFEESSINDNKIVQVVGEVIGDKIASDEPGYCWITLTSTNEDSPTTISVLLTEEQAAQIDHYGRYGVVGTTFQVRGVYHQACRTHEGLPDIHATNSATITRGIEHHDKLRLRHFVPGAALVFVGLVLMGVYYFVREKMR